MQNNNSRAKLPKEIFENPPSEYRGAPFWAWNTDLNESELLWQIDKLKEMGFGGFFMHTRSGMSTEYLSEEFMRLISACNRKAKENEMYSYLYDEDRWPSGAAGGYVTENKAYRQKSIVLSLCTPEEMAELHKSDERDPVYLLAYDIVFDTHGKIQTYAVVAPEQKASGEKWYAYMLLAPKSGWFNGYTEIDSLNPDAVDRFIESTHAAYKKTLGEEFGKSAPAIFTDEPRYGIVNQKARARDGLDVSYPWSESARSAFMANYGYDITERMPEVIWDRADGKPAKERYRYFQTLTELFAATYGNRIGQWCSHNGIAFTGHYMEEPTLHSQLCAIGEAMLQYKEYTIPGIDMLCNRKEFSTAKQAQSAVHQFGRKGMMSELYGVTGWEFDFRGHKFQGDWQAALGVTLRVPHLAWVSMRGSAKRDYPASIGYQSSWYREYGYIENHFARLNTALTRGEPLVRVAVIHPIESAWLIEGVREYTATQSDALEKQFQNTIEWLLRGQMDFDFVSESLLPELYHGEKEDFCVGEMQYKAVLVPPVVGLRSTTIDALSRFAAKGGKVIVCGDCPVCVDGEQSEGAKDLWQNAQKIDFAQAEILNALAREREIAIYGSDGKQRQDLLYAMRQEGENKWLFIAHCDQATRNNGDDDHREDLRLVVRGIYTPELYDTLTGEIHTVNFAHENGNTVIYTPSYPYDSFLYSLVPAKDLVANVSHSQSEQATQNIQIPDFVPYSLGEDNVLVLDMPQWSRDGVTFMPREEMLRIDNAVRRQLNYTPADGYDVQPWKLTGAPPQEYVWLKFTIESESGFICKFAYEYADKVLLNGKDIPVCKKGYFVDKEIYTMPLPAMKKGKNELLVRAPISERISLENMFLLGDFGVQTLGSAVKLVAPATMLTFDGIGKQGMPFYGAAVTYTIPFACERGAIDITADYYVGALIGAKLDGKDAGKIVLPPYTLTIDDVQAGEHTLELTLYATRVNTFGALHMAVPLDWKGPNMWYTQDNMWSYEYRLSDVGILKKPTLVWRNNTQK